MKDQSCNAIYFTHQNYILILLRDTCMFYYSVDQEVGRKLTSLLLSNSVSGVVIKDIELNLSFVTLHCFIDYLNMSLNLKSPV